MASGDERPYTTDAPNDRLGRKAIKRDRSPNFCLWLQAEVRIAAIYFGFTSSTGHSANAPTGTKRRRSIGVDRRLVVMAVGTA